MMTDLVDSDDPFNSRGKSRCVNEDEPLPLTKASREAREHFDDDTPTNDIIVVSAPRPIKPLMRKPKPAVSNRTNDKENERPKQPSTKTTGVVLKAPNTSTHNHTKLSEVPIEGDMGFDECVSILSQMPSFDPSLIEQLHSNQWQQITQALSSLEQWIAQHQLTKQLSCACLLRVLIEHPSYTSANFQVVKSLLALTNLILETDSFILPSSTACSLTVPLLVKLADRKVSPLAEQTLRLVAVASSPRCLIQCIHESLPSIKVIKSLEAALLFIAVIISDFSIQACDLQRIQSLANTSLESSQSLIRAAAVKVLVAAYSQLGPKSRPYFLLPIASQTHIIDTVTVAFNQIDEQLSDKSPLANTPQFAGRAPHASITRIDVDSLVPRRDLTSMLSPSVAVSLKEKAWKPRLQSLETITQAIESCHGKVACKDAGLIAAIAASVGDSNKILHVKALQVLLLLVQSTTDGLARHASKIVAPALVSLSDSKKQVKDEACALLALWLSKNNLHAATIKGWKQALESPTARSDAFTLIVEWLDKSSADLLPGELDLSEFVNAGIEALIDKSADTRLKAERFIEHAAARGLAQSITQAMLKLKQAHMMQIKHIVERCIAQARQSHIESQPVKTASTSQPKISTQAQQNSHPKTPSQIQQPSQARNRPEESARQMTPTRLAAAAAQTTETEPISHPFLSHVDTAARSRRLLRDSKRVAHADFRPMTQDECTEMTNGLKSFVLPALLSSMMDTDGTKSGLAFDFFMDELSDESTTVLPYFHAIADLLFHWLVWRIERATQTKSMLRCLELADLLISQFGVANMELADTDLSTLVPVVIERGLGHSVASIRQVSASLLLKIRANGQCLSHRMTHYLNKGLESKNKRVALESCECLATLLNSFPDAAAEIKRSLPTIINMVSSSDPAARTSALHTLQVAHDQLGDDTFWSSVGDLKSNDKARQIIEERITRKQVDSLIVHAQPNTIQHVERSPLRVRRPATATATRSPVSTAPSMLALSSSFASLQAMQASLQQPSVCNSWTEVDMAFNLTNDGKHRRSSAIEYLYQQLRSVEQHATIKHRLPLMFRALERSIALKSEAEREFQSSLLCFIAQYAAHPAIQNDIYVERGFDSQTAIQLGRLALLVSATHPDQSGRLHDACARIHTFLNLDEQLSAICSAQFALLAEGSTLGMSQQMLFDWGSKISSVCLIDVPTAVSMLHRLDMTISASNHPQLSQNHDEAVSHCLSRLLECDKVAVLSACRGLDQACNIARIVHTIIQSIEQQEAEELRKIEETRYAPVFPQTNLKGRRSRKLMQSIQPLIQDNPQDVTSESASVADDYPQPMSMNDLLCDKPTQSITPQAIASTTNNLSSFSYSERFRSIQARIRESGESQSSQPAPVVSRTVPTIAQLQQSSNNKAQPALEARLQAMAAIRERMKARSVNTPNDPSQQTTSLANLMNHL